MTWLNWNRFASECPRNKIFNQTKRYQCRFSKLQASGDVNELSAQQNRWQINTQSRCSTAQIQFAERAVLVGSNYDCRIDGVRSQNNLIGSLTLRLKAFDIFPCDFRIWLRPNFLSDADFPLPLIIELKTSRNLIVESIDSGCARRQQIGHAFAVWKYSASEARKLSLLIAFLRSLSTLARGKFSFAYLHLVCNKKAAGLAFIFNLYRL